MTVTNSGQILLSPDYRTNRATWLNPLIILQTQQLVPDDFLKSVLKNLIFQSITVCLNNNSYHISGETWDHKKKKGEQSWAKLTSFSLKFNTS